LLEPEEEVAEGVIAGKTGDPKHGMEDTVGAQPFAVGEALRPNYHRHQKGRQ
jgi:hypothetical protein